METSADLQAKIDKIDARRKAIEERIKSLKNEDRELGNERGDLCRKHDDAFAVERDGGLIVAWDGDYPPGGPYDRVWTVVKVTDKRIFVHRQVTAARASSSIWMDHRAVNGDRASTSRERLGLARSVPNCGRV